MRILNNVPVWGEADDATLSQIFTCAKTATRVALMADNHKGYAVPIGGVVAYENSVSPSAVGYDIACGNKAVLTNLMYEDIRDDVPALMDLIWNNISFGVGQKNNTKVDHKLFDDP